MISASCLCLGELSFYISSFGETTSFGIPPRRHRSSGVFQFFLSSLQIHRSEFVSPGASAAVRKLSSAWENAPTAGTAAHPEFKGKMLQPKKAMPMQRSYS